jgi:hypothetical protein
MVSNMAVGLHRILPKLTKRLVSSLGKYMKPTDLLLGWKTFEFFADYWPTHAEMWPGINDVTKYVMSNSIDN